MVPPTDDAVPFGGQRRRGACMRADLGTGAIPHGPARMPGSRGRRTGRRRRSPGGQRMGLSALAAALAAALEALAALRLPGAVGSLAAARFALRAATDLAAAGGVRLIADPARVLGAAFLAPVALLPGLQAPRPVPGRGRLQGGPAGHHGDCAGRHPAQRVAPGQTTRQCRAITSNFLASMSVVSCRRSAAVFWARAAPNISGPVSPSWSRGQMSPGARLVERGQHRAGAEPRRAPVQGVTRPVGDVGDSRVGAGRKRTREPEKGPRGGAVRAAPKRSAGERESRFTIT